MPARASLARGLTVWHLILDQGVPGSNPGALANLPEHETAPDRRSEGRLDSGRNNDARGVIEGTGLAVSR